jgi:peptide/nickel transport system ATP-binding protein
VSAVLAIKGLRVSLAEGSRRRPVLRGVTLGVEAGEVHGLVGQSGAGKTMVGRAVLGILPRGARIDAGGIAFSGEDVTHLPERRRRRLLGKGMALIPQDPMTSLNPSRTIGRQMGDVLALHLGLGRAAARARAAGLLDEVRLRQPTALLDRYPHELSGGMRQRVLIAIAFACRPALVIADEPTTALDVTVQRRILRLIRDLQRGHGTAVLFVTHNLGVVAKVCDRVSVLHAGRILESGTAAEVVGAPRHPYTRALMAATPRWDRPAETLRPVPPALMAALEAEAAASDGAHAGHTPRG